VVIVTGANTGVGYATLQHLVRHGAKVYLGARSEKKATVAIEQLQKEGLGPGNGEVVWLDVDLSDARKAKAAAESFLQKETRLDILINNAALVVSMDYKRTFDDVQDSMMVNHISPFVFTRTLLPLMKETSKEPGSDVRIVVLSSNAIFHIPNGIRFRDRDDFNRDFSDIGVSSLKRYGMSKLANVLFAKQLQRNLSEEGSSIIVTAVHPGGVNHGSNTNLEPSAANQELLTSVNGMMRILIEVVTKHIFIPTTKGAYTSVFAAAAPEVREKPEVYKGAYLVPVAKLREASEDATNEELAKELWETTERILSEIGV